MEKKLVLTFITKEKKHRSLILRSPKENLSLETINTVAEKIISTKIFNTIKYELESLSKASYVTREEQIIQ